MDIIKCTDNHPLPADCKKLDLVEDKNKQNAFSNNIMNLEFVVTDNGIIPRGISWNEYKKSIFK